MQYQVSLARNRAGTWEVVIEEHHPEAVKQKRLEARRIISVIDSPAQDLVLEQLASALVKMQEQLGKTRQTYV